MTLFDYHSQYNPQTRQEIDLANQASDAMATREAGDYEAAANQQTAERTNSLAQRLATARRTPGGGIRMGAKRKGLSANTAGVGLNRANAAGRLDRRKSELRTQSRKALADKYNNMQNTVNVGAPIRLW